MPKLPSVVSKLPGDLRQFLDRVREALSGSGWDRFVTARELRNAGLVSGNTDGSVLTNPSTNVQCANPPAPTGVTTNGAITNIMVHWDLPNYACHAFAEVWAAPADDFGTKILVGETSSTFFTHPVGPGETRYYWVRFVSETGAFGQFNTLVGTLGQTAQDPEYLLGLLAGQITEDELYQDLNTRIDKIDTSAIIDGQAVVGGIIAKYEAEILGVGGVVERLTDIDAPVTGAIAVIDTALNGVGGVVERLTDIDTPDTGTLALEAAARALGDVTEAQARVDGIQAEALARVADVQTNAETALNALTAINSTRNELLAGVTQATFELTQYVDDGISAEATARLALKAQLELDDDVLAAAVLSEQNARVSADGAEATARLGLAAQILGADGTAQTAGLIWQESQTRASQDEALSQQITLLSAGAGETFDFKKIWYFDTGVEGWTSNGGTPTSTLGWLRPYNHGSDPYVISPTVSENGDQYTQVRVRIRKTGTPTWDGKLSWYASSAWSSYTISPEPEYDTNGISVVTINPAWTGTIEQIKLELSTTQTVTDYFEIDWVAIGRPAPGASTASVFDLSRATVDLANNDSLAYKMTALTAKVDDPVSGNTALATAISNTYTKAQADSALAGRESAIAARYGTTANKIFRQDTAPVQGTTNLTTQTGTVAVDNISNGDIWIDTNDGNKQYVWEIGGWVERQNTSLFGTTAFSTATEDYLANGEGAFVTQIQTTVALVNDPETGNVAAIAAANEALEATATLDETIVRESKQLYAAQGGYAENDLRNAVANHENAGKIRGAMATVIQDAWANTKEGIEAEAGRREELAAVVDGNQAYIIENYYTKATTDESIAEVNLYIEAKTDEATAFILEESRARATETEAIATQLNALSAEVDDARSMVVTEAQARATQGEAVASQIDLLYTNTEASNALVLNQLESYAGATSAVATATEVLRTEFDTAKAEAFNQTQTQSELNKASAANIDLLRATVDGNQALVLNQTEARATLDEAFASDFRYMSAAVDTAKAEAFNQTQTQSELNKASATNLDLLRATVDGNQAFVLNQTEARATLDEAFASDFRYMSAAVDAAKAEAFNQTQVQSTATQAIASDLSFLRTSVDGNNALALGYAEVQSTATQAVASGLDLLNATVQGNNAYALENTKAQADTTSAMVENVRILSAAVDGNNALSLNQTFVQADATAALAREIDYLSATVDNNTASAFNQTTTQATTNSAVAEQLNSLSATVDGANAMIGTYSVAMADAVSAQAKDLYTLQAAFEDNVASVTRLTQAMSTSISSFAQEQTQVSSLLNGYSTMVEATSESLDGIKGQYTVKIDNNGYMSGFGLSSDLIDGKTPSSKFIVTVDQFAVATPMTGVPSWTASTDYMVGDTVKIAGTTDKVLVCKTGNTGLGPYNKFSGTVSPSLSELSVIGSAITDNGIVWQVASSVPFVVQTTGTSVGGVPVPAGIYMDAAYIVNGTVNNAQIGELSADKITVGTLNAARIGAGTITASGDIFVGNTTAGHLALNAANKSLTISDGARTRFQASPTGIGIYDSAGTAILTSGSSLQDQMFGVGGKITSANASTYIASAAIGFAYIADDIQSSDYSAGSAGWKIAKGGQMEMNNATFRGTLDVKSSATGARLIVRNNVIMVHDGTRVRVKLGDLSASEV